MRPRSLLVALAASCSGGDGACEALEPAAPGARLLFDGTAESLARWAHAGPGAFELEEDCTVRTSGGLGLLWYDDEPVAAPATVRVEWMTPGDSNAGVFVCFPAVGDDPLVAVERGYEVQIDASDEAGWTTGAIYGFQVADAGAVEEALNEPGSRNTFEIALAPPEIVVSLNGRVVNRFTSTDPARMDLARLRRPPKPRPRGCRPLPARRGEPRLGGPHGDRKSATGVRQSRAKRTDPPFEGFDGPLPQRGKSPLPP